ncbi:unnamed protein product [Brachionus calyciflorus]|uniref:Uncharacterized protein n=1 Tax=Brachionus calyciflorus TaxID=104777 RepID=A0A814H0B3_9BILA|nr:unnamed protein product [Brachionus calyciflorus]
MVLRKRIIFLMLFKSFGLIFNFKYVYLGCYAHQHNRDLKWFAFGSASITINFCVNVCFENNYKYAGLQSSFECFCGNKYGTYGISNNCNMECNGNQSQICGGSWSNSVYKISLVELKCDKRIIKINETIECTIDSKENDSILEILINFTNQIQKLRISPENPLIKFNYSYSSKGFYEVQISDSENFILDSISISVVTFDFVKCPNQVFLNETFEIEIETFGIKEPIYLKYFYDQQSIEIIEISTKINLSYSTEGNHSLELRSKSGLFQTNRSVEVIKPIQFSNQPMTLDFENLEHFLYLFKENIDIFDCLNNCSNNGKCVFASKNNYKCVCSENYFGPQCNINTNPCSSKKCLNKGKCVLVNESNEFKCECDKNYEGKYCEILKDFCENRTCSNHGVCFFNMTSQVAECKCFNLYYGINCEIEFEALKALKNVIKTSSIIAITNKAKFEDKQLKKK